MPNKQYVEKEREDPRHWSDEAEELKNFKLLRLWGDRRVPLFYKENYMELPRGVFGISILFTENGRAIGAARQRNFFEKIRQNAPPQEVADALRTLADKIDGGYPQ